MADGGGFIDRSPLPERLAELRAQSPLSDPAAIVEVVRAVLSTMRGDLTSMDASLLTEVQDLGRTIANARAEIAALKVDDINAAHIPSATDELDAIVAHTAAATEAILETCETLDKVADELGGPTVAVLQQATSKIYEACSFQDITGQRITKVVATLKAIDAKVAQIIAAFGGQACDIRPAAQLPARTGPESLLNGPQLPATAMDQSDIDRLMADFD